MSRVPFARLRVLSGTAVVTALIAAAGLGRPAAQQLPRDLPPPFANGFAAGAAPELCGTLDPATEAALRFRPRRVLQDNIPVWFDQEPPLVGGDYRGAVSLRNFLVTGDVESIRFKGVGRTDVETWPRAGIGQIGTRTVSIFSPTWGQERLSEAFAAQQVGFDNPYMYWGEALPPGVDAGGGYNVYLRVMSGAIPQVIVAQPADDVQYSSSVVNIRLDDFGSSQLLNDENDYGFERVTRRFYEQFQDSYDSIAITTASLRLTSSTAAAFHRRVRNDVTGIGQPIFDNSAAYGSTGRLSGIEFYEGGYISANRSVAHETAHRWSSGIDWARLLGITPAGHQPTAHEPLMSGGETRMGAVLEGTRRVESDGGAWTIQKTPAPIRFHPYTLYTMGLLDPGAVPEITFFDDQGQFNATSTATPAIGTAVSGATRTATAFSLVGMYGRREGPVPKTWEQATVVVSSGRLLSRREMDYFTFYAQRTADPNATGVVTWNGHGSFDSATSRQIDLIHEIRPRGAEPIREALPVDFPRFAPDDFRDIRPDSAVASVYDVGERMRVSGTVTAKDRADFDTVLIRLRRDPNGTGDQIRAQNTVNGSGRFELASPVFTADQRGQWVADVFLFWPGSGTQFAREYHSVITVR